MIDIANMENKQLTIPDIREYFEFHYPYVNMGYLEDKTIENFMKRDYIKDLSNDRKLDCLYDYIVSQGLTEVNE
jgi:hypothetical protein